jgi:hypothetical protein
MNHPIRRDIPKRRTAVNLLPERNKAVDTDAKLRCRAKEGLFIDNATGSVFLNWPQNVAKFPYGAAWIELRRGESIVGQGMMVVRLNRDGTHHFGSVRLVDLGVMPHETKGLCPEAWAVWKEDLAEIPRLGVEQLLQLPEFQSDGNAGV